MSRAARDENTGAREFAESFHKRLRDALDLEAKRTGRLRGDVMPQKELAEKLAALLHEKAVTSATISRWYRGLGLPEPHRIPGIAAVLGVSKKWATEAAADIRAAGDAFDEGKKDQA